MPYKFFIVCMFVLVYAGSAAQAHLHINMVPNGTAAGSQLAISFYSDPGGFAIVDTGSRLEFQQDGEIYTVTADTQATQAQVDLLPGAEGMLRGRIHNFTADGDGGLLNNPAGRDQPVGYEILSVTSLSDPSLDVQVLWQLFRSPGAANGALLLPNPYEGYATYSGDSLGLTAEDRSYLLPVGAHSHGNASVPDSGFWLFTDAPVGLYEITIRAWDVQGHFLASAPVTFQMNVIPEPTSLMALLGGSLMLVLRRRRSARAC